MKFFAKKECRFLYHSKTGSMGFILYDQLKDWNIDPNNKERTVIQLFHDAASRDDLKKVKQGVEAGIPTDIVDDSGLTLLSTAARNGALKTLAFLTEEKCSMTFSRAHIKKALHAACAAGQFEAICYLLNATSLKLHINIRERYSAQLPIQTAISAFQFDCAEKIMNQLKPNLVSVDKNNLTPLATLFSCYINHGFEKIKNNKEQLEKLEALCLRLLQKVDPFAEENGHLAAYSVFDSHEFDIRILLTVAPKLAEKLKTLAEKNCETDSLQDKFLKSYHCSEQSELDEQREHVNCFN